MLGFDITQSGKLNNPAIRLYDLLKKGKSQPADISISQTWANILDAPIDNKTLLLRRIGYVYELPSKIEQSINETKGINHEIYLRWLPSVKGSFSMINFQPKWGSFISRFDKETMYGIELCADTLSRTSLEKVISESELNDLSKKIQEMLDEFSDEKLPIEIGNFIFQRLIEIKEALEEYPYRGTDPLESVLEESIGCVVISPIIYQGCQETSFGKKFWKVLGNIAILVSITAGLIKIGEETIPLFPNTIDSIDVVPKNLDNDNDDNVKVI